MPIVLTSVFDEELYEHQSDNFQNIWATFLSETFLI
jgi:hypothetical protein